MSELLTVEQCAQLARVSKETILRFAQYGLLPSTKEATAEGEELRIAQTEVEKLFRISGSGMTSAANPTPNFSTVQTVSEASSSNSETESSQVAVEFTETSPPLSQEIAQYTHSSLPIVSSEEIMLHNRTLRDQIEVLKTERDWLRARVEKLEALQEREQMLHLANTETLRSIVAAKTKRRGFMAYLPWRKA